MQKNKAMRECYLLEKCGFFSHFASSTEMDCRKLIETYCRGPKVQECKRLYYFNHVGVPPSDYMMPDGTIVRESITR